MEIFLRTKFRISFERVPLGLRTCTQHFSCSCSYTFKMLQNCTQLYVLNVEREHGAWIVQCHGCLGFWGKLDVCFSRLRGSLITALSNCCIGVLDIASSRYKVRENRREGCWDFQLIIAPLLALYRLILLFHR